MFIGTALKVSWSFKHVYSIRLGLSLRSIVFNYKGHPAIFDITKRKFHNVLQGVNKPGTKLHEEEKTMFEKWTESMSF